MVGLQGYQAGSPHDPDPLPVEPLLAAEGRAAGTPPAISVVVPAFNAARTIGLVLEALTREDARPHEVIVVDDGSTDSTAALAEQGGARVIRSAGTGYAGGARNTGWEAATGDVVVFLDSDAIPHPGWTAGVARAAVEFPGAIVGSARTFTGKTSWGWVAHLQCETPYLPRGAPRDVRFVSSYCMAVPRDLPIRFDESYGGEDGIFCADALDAGLRLVFDPRYSAHHDHSRGTFRALRAQQRRLAYGLARIGAVQREGLHKRILARVPVHYFVLARLLPIYRRVQSDPVLRTAFVGNLPKLVLAEWTLGLSAVRYAVKRPALRGQDGAGFR